MAGTPDTYTNSILIPAWNQGTPTYEKNAKTTGSCRGGLGGTILLGAEMTSKYPSKDTSGGECMAQRLHRQVLELVLTGAWVTSRRRF
jgi:hypothetical protein